ncbi:putative E3 ubiquitin-protein ligase makorin-2 [Dissostichus eleginoides]|uniref:RING-type E3 ubiquitin transferase n=1 Tax=Dissostichus eleginoides TaxID=100907 RepID=A0AAD9CGU7_DISEL|nr:putative E3 ubiquitin-protein ligase makorin-2 [Dissostichus eleginoides]
MAKYFLHGVCREGSRCLFSHDPNTSKPSTICKFYQRGVCAYGERCRYDHIKSSRGGGASEEPPGVGGAGGGPSVGGCGPSVGGGRKPLVLRDRAIRTGLEASSEEPGNPPVGGAYHDPRQLCPYAAAGQCYYGDSCTYLHGDLCEVCRLQVLHPHDPEQRRAHEKADMEKAFAAQLSQDKVCSICMELVVQKLNPCERRFGILSSCCHTFCLTCIRQWRCTRSFSNSIINFSNKFVIPSVFWVEDQEEKDHLIDLFKSGVSKKSCKYFDQGRGVCPFGGKCLYLHALPDGTRAEPDRPRKQLSSEGGVRMSGPGRESEEPPAEEPPLRNPLQH